jgi:hypothetical protein
MTIIGLIITLIVVLFVIWATERLLVVFAVADPARTVIYVLVVLLVMLWAIGRHFA